LPYRHVLVLPATPPPTDTAATAAPPAAANEAQVPVVQQPSLQADAQAPEATPKATLQKDIQKEREKGGKGCNGGALAVLSDAAVSLVVLIPAGLRAPCGLSH